MQEERGGRGGMMEKEGQDRGSRYRRRNRCVHTRMRKRNNLSRMSCRESHWPPCIGATKSKRNSLGSNPRAIYGLLRGNELVGRHRSGFGKLHGPPDAGSVSAILHSTTLYFYHPYGRSNQSDNESSIRGLIHNNLLPLHPLQDLNSYTVVPHSIPKG